MDYIWLSSAIDFDPNTTDCLVSEIIPNWVPTVQVSEINRPKRPEVSWTVVTVQAI
jgi:hypothetical protein